MNRKYSTKMRIRFVRGFLLSLVAFIFSSCSNSSSGGGSGTNNGSGENDSFSVSQNLTMTGDDNAFYGSTLEVGTLFTKASNGTIYPDQVILYDKKVTIIDDSGNSTTTDPQNGFAIVINHFANNPQYISVVSMGIKVNGVNYKYTCENPARTFYYCGEGVEIDLQKRSLTLTDVSVQNTTNRSVIMKMNGTIQW
jgi:hypothetical protein